MRTPDGKWQVEVITCGGRQTFRVKMLHQLTPPGSGWTPIGQLVSTLDEVQELLGDAFAELRDVPARPAHPVR